MVALPSFPGVPGCDSSTVGAAESGVRSYLTQGKFPVPAALTSHPCADKALLGSASPSSSSLTCNFPGETTSYSQLAEAAVRIGIWSCSCWSAGMEGRGDISACPFPPFQTSRELPCTNRLSDKEYHQTPVPCPAAETEPFREPSGTRARLCSCAALSNAASSGIQWKKLARN